MCQAVAKSERSKLARAPVQEHGTTPSSSLPRIMLSRVPAEAGGIALNCAGMGSWLSAMCELHPVLEPAYEWGSILCVTLAVIIIVLLALQALFHQAHFRGECMKPKQCGSIGGLLMGFSLCCSYLRFVDGSGDSAFIMVHFAAALQTVMVLYYFFWTNKMKSPPVPYW